MALLAYQYLDALVVALPFADFTLNVLYRAPRLQWHWLQWYPGYSDSFGLLQSGAYHGILLSNIWVQLHMCRNLRSQDNPRRGGSGRLTSRGCTTCRVRGHCTIWYSPQDVLPWWWSSQQNAPHICVDCDTLLRGTYDRRQKLKNMCCVNTFDDYSRCPLMQSGQSPASGWPDSVQFEKSMHSVWAGSHDHHLQSLFLPHILWQDSASVDCPWKLTEYSCNESAISKIRGLYLLQTPTWHCPRT